MAKAAYPTWKAQAGAKLKELHDIDPKVIPEKVWKQCFVAGGSVDDAVASAQTWHWNNNQRVAEQRRKRRK